MNHARIERHAAGDEAWLLASRRTCAAVRPAVPCYIGYEEHSVRPVRRLQFPHPNVTVIVNLGHPVAVHAPALMARGPTFGSFAAGVFDTVAETSGTGESMGIELNVTPIGMWQLLGIRMAELHNRVVALSDLLGAAGAHLQDRLQHEPSWDARFDLLDAELTVRLAARPAPRQIMWAWTALTQASSRLSVADVGRELQWSRRRIAEEFRMHVGMTPKAVSRLARFDRVVRTVRAGGHVSWSGLAATSGYADQSHLVREFREFAGMSPTEFEHRHGTVLPGLPEP